VWVARPVYEVYNAGRFDLVFANDLDEAKLAKATKEEFKTIPWRGPKLIGAKSPSDAKLRNELLLSSLTGGEDLPQRVEYYVPYVELQADVLRRKQPLENLLKFNASKRPDVELLLKRYAGRDVGYLPLRGKVNDLTVIVNGQTAQVLERVDLEPW
jgi:hypothetical protein